MLRQVKVPADHLRSIKTRAELNLNEHDRVLLIVGSGFKTKGVDRAIIALSALPKPQRQKTSLVVVGKGKENHYRRLARKLGIAQRVLFTGPRQDVAALYRCADLLIHPARSENTGTTLLEAMLSSLPVLATENCGYAFHVADARAGRICPLPFQQEQLNKILLEMINSDQKTQWQKNARDYCDTHDLYSMIDKSVEIILKRAQKNRRQPLKIDFNEPRP
ncbi:MAG: glycosyltransferase family 4 protein [Planctomycetes bacterium]|nr:glycosyltransferase family 4 protein [Planctomycetota bacterium]